MFTRDQFGTDQARFSDRIGLLFTRDRSGTGPERIQNWSGKGAGPVWIRSGPVPERSRVNRSRTGPVPCKRSLRKSDVTALGFYGDDHSKISRARILSEQTSEPVWFPGPL